MIDFSKFKLPRESLELIMQIAARAHRECDQSPHHPFIKDFHGLVLDLEACHALACPLKLDLLLAAPKSDFNHDVVGIYNHLNRDNGQLDNCFTPRFALKNFVRA